jgi:hypothetical protein
MKKLFLLLLPLVLAGLVFGGYLLYSGRTTGKGALQVTSVPQSNVYLNGKLIGKTPLCKCELPDMLDVGNYTIRLEPTDKDLLPFEEKVPIGKSILTVVDRTFGKGGTSEGSVITLLPVDDKKSVELLLLSFPDKSDIFLDNNPFGQTPTLQKNVTESDHEVKLIKQGYKDKAIRIRTVAGYKLVATVYLGIDENLSSSSASASPSASPTPSTGPSTTPSPSPKISGKVTPTPTLKPGSKVSPTPTGPSVTILQTPTGFLRVRAEASVSSAEIARVTPGETYPLEDESTGWYQIKLTDGKLGWVSSQYAEKQ